MDRYHEKLIDSGMAAYYVAIYNKSVFIELRETAEFSSTTRPNLNFPTNVQTHTVNDIIELVWPFDANVSYLVAPWVLDLLVTPDQAGLVLLSDLCILRTDTTL